MEGISPAGLSATLVLTNPLAGNAGTPCREGHSAAGILRHSVSVSSESVDAPFGGSRVPRMSIRSGLSAGSFILTPVHPTKNYTASMAPGQK